MTPQQREARINRAKAHAAADRLRSGFYSDDICHSIGCSVGCDAIDIAGWQETYKNPHAIVAAHDGTPEWLEHLRDRIFEGLPSHRRAWWHVSLAEALPADVDLQPAYHLICIRLLERQLSRRTEWDNTAYGDQVAAALEKVIAHHRDPSESAAESARSAAWSAESAAWSAAESAESAAWSAVRSAESARSAARSAAESAESAAWSAAESAESAVRSAAWSAESAEYVWIAEIVIDVFASIRKQST